MSEINISQEHHPENKFIDAQNPPFWVAKHLYNKNTYVIYRQVSPTIHEEIKVLVTGSILKHVEKLSPEEKMYFKRRGIV